MRQELRDSRRTFLTGLLLLPLAGCGSSTPSVREDIAKQSPEELYGASIKSLLFEFRAKVRKRGVAAAKKEAPLVLENLAGYEQQPVGQHLETLKKIEDTLKDLEKRAGGKMTKEEAVSSADMIGDLAAKLPGKANENPRVE
jgi:hypothetical protein